MTNTITNTMSQSHTAIKSLFYAFVLAVASSGLVSFNWLPSLAMQNGNLAFFIAYAVCLFIISTPLLSAEITSGFLSKKTMTGTLKMLTRSNRFRSFVLIALISAFPLIIILLIKSALGLNFALNSLENVSMNPDMPLYQSLIQSKAHLHNVISLDGAMLIAMLIIMSLVLLANLFRCKAMFISFFSLFGFVLLIVITLSMIALKSQDTGGFFKANWYYLSLFHTWGNAAIASVLTVFSGLGIFMLIGHQLPEKTPLKAFTVTYMLTTLIIGFASCLLLYSLIPHEGLITPNFSIPFSALYQALSASPQSIEIGFYLCLTLISLSSLILIIRPFIDMATKSMKKQKLQIFVILTAIYIIVAAIYSTSQLNTLLMLKFITIDYLIPFTALCICFFVGWIYDAQNLSYRLRKATGIRLSSSFHVLIRLLIPTWLLSLLLNGIYWQQGYVYHAILVLICFVTVVITGSLLHRRFK
ncbi:MAG: hypothetical protein ACO2ZM_04130 [Francisellaceae bacterium]